MLRELTDIDVTDLRAAVADVIAVYDGGTGVSLGNLHVPRNLRNHIAHGGPLPRSVEVVTPLTAFVQAVEQHIEKALASAKLDFVEGPSRVKVPTLTWGRIQGKTVSLWPFVFSPTEGEWCLFTRFGSGRPEFYSFGNDGQATASIVPESVLADLNKALSAARPASKTLDHFQADVRRDLKGFLEQSDTQLGAIETDYGFEVSWRKATGTGDGFEDRRDHFRLGPDDQRQWRSDEDWVGYSTYLREIANWPVIARRLKLSLEETSKRLADDETRNLGWIRRSMSEDRPTRIVLTDLDGSREERSTFSELLSNVDVDLQSNRPQTQVVFINGEAGIGKTRAMISAAIRRARDVEHGFESGAPSDLPLLLYVGSTGQVLSQLDQVVAAAVSNTRSLTADAVKALCRNGLMALLVDGFDELLGNVRYNDALGSLRPWLVEMGGRGVIVVSARSSYYVGQYKASVQRAHESSNLAVQHRIAEIQRWKPAEVESIVVDYGVEAAVLNDLSDSDRDLLGLPFFARAFIEMHLSADQKLPSGAALTEHLLGQYIAREEGKIVDENGHSVISRDELKSMFGYVAELMDENSEREADHDLLKSAAEFAIGDDLDTRGGLTERLASLCGLSVDSGNTKKFRFQHELFFDQFLGNAVLGYIDHGKPSPRFQALLGSSVWRRATIDQIASNLGELELASLLDTNFCESSISTAKREATAANVGSLWQELIRSTQKMSYKIRGARFIDDLDLRNVTPGQMIMINARVGVLHLPGPSGWSLELSDAPVKKLRMRTRELSGLKGIDVSELLEIITSDELIERQDQIATTLISFGAEVVNHRVAIKNDTNEDIAAAEHFLRRAMDRGEYYWILLKGSLRVPEDDGSLRRKTEEVYGREAWTSFVRALLESCLASASPMGGAGSAKVRVRLTMNAGQILDRDVDDDRVTQFWDRLSGF